MTKGNPRILILVGSTNVAPRPRNPWNYAERSQMIRQSISERWPELTTSPERPSTNSANLYVYLGRFQPFHNGHLHVIEQVAEEYGTSPVVEIRPLPDMTYNMEGWLAQVQNIVSRFEPDNSKVSLIGHTKDETTNDYLSLFPQWKFWNVPAYKNFTKAVLDASSLRKVYFTTGISPATNFVPNAVTRFLSDFQSTEKFQYLLEYQKYVDKYQRDNVIGRKYAPTFQTVDSVVVQSGHVLVVKRKAHPGMGLWALPGGYFDANTDISLMDAAIRELLEETSINLQKDTLKRCIKAYEPFDDMYRSELGRLITMAYLFHLRPGPLPKIKKRDKMGEVSDVIWMPLSEAQNHCELFHDDHGHVINKMTRGL